MTIWYCQLGIRSTAYYCAGVLVLRVSIGSAIVVLRINCIQNNTPCNRSVVMKTISINSKEDSSTETSRKEGACAALGNARAALFDQLRLLLGTGRCAGCRVRGSGGGGCAGAAHVAVT